MTCLKPIRILAGAAVAIAVSGSAIAAAPRLMEESYARDEERRIIMHPIAGIENSRWFDYRNDIAEAQKELSSDLRRATDLEDRRDAWEEYANELSGERREYIKAMAKKGYRDPRVTVG